MSKRQIFTLFILLVFLHYVYGCTKTVKVYQDEITTPKEKIVQLVLSSGDVINFDDRGGKYQFQHASITGVNEQGRSISIPLERISEVRLSKPRAITKEELTGQKITEVILLNRKVVKFDRQGGFYDEKNGVITGTRSDGVQVNWKVHQIREIRISEPEVIPIEEVRNLKPKGIAEVISQNGRAFIFDTDGGTFQPEKRSVTGVSNAGKTVEIDADDILYARVSRADPAMTTFTVIGALALAFVSFLVIFAVSSCPFVYSYDGEKYIFDAEPYGGAICPGLKKSDYSRMEHLKPVNGKYRLLLKNEVPETQYTDEMKLLIVDHAPDTEIIPDPLGNMYTIKNLLSPARAVDEKGRDLMKFLKERDEIAWQTHLPTDSSFRGQDLRHHLTFEFPKPAEVKTAKLIFNGGTALWGSEMIRKMLELRGNRVDEWYEAVNRGEEELAELVEFVERDELYTLKVYVEEGNEWIQREFIPGAGPFIYEDRVIPLDISGVWGDTLRIRLNPPMAFWAIDYIGVEYGNYPSPEVQEISLAAAEDQYGEDVSAILREIDDQYQVMPEIGDWAKVNFEVPPEKDGAKRSIFLKSTGYYEIHLSKDQPEQTELIQKILATPGMIHEFALEEYLKWRSAQISLK